MSSRRRPKAIADGLIADLGIIAKPVGRNVRPVAFACTRVEWC